MNEPILEPKIKWNQFKENYRRKLNNKIRKNQGKIAKIIEKRLLNQKDIYRSFTDNIKKGKNYICLTDSWLIYLMSIRWNLSYRKKLFKEVKKDQNLLSLIQENYGENFSLKVRYYYTWHLYLYWQN